MATAFLLQAIDRGYRGYFTTFPTLINQLYASLADHSEEKLIHQYCSYDCLVIDEVGYVEVEPAQVGLFFTLMQSVTPNKALSVTGPKFSNWQRGTGGGGGHRSGHALGSTGLRLGGGVAGAATGSRPLHRRGSSCLLWRQIGTCC